MKPPSIPLPLRLQFLVLLALLLPAVALAQGIDVANRPIKEIRVEGLKQVPRQLVENQIRLSPGEPYNPKVVEEDIVRITYLGRFSSVQAKVEPQADGSVILTYVLLEQPLLSDVQVVGNKAINDQELLGLVVLRAGDPADSFLIDRGIQQIKRAYEQRGYFVTDVTMDKNLLADSGILIYRVREGPKVTIRDIRIQGNKTYTDEQLKAQIRSKTRIFIFRKGELNREQLDNDAARLRDYYRDHGYLDAQVGREIRLAPTQKTAVIVFLVEEGRRYTLSQIRVVGNSVFPSEQVLLTLPMKPGDVFSAEASRKATQTITDMYGKLGYLQTKVEINRLFHEQQPVVDMVVQIDEGRSNKVGKVTIRGNQLTQDKVILRQLRGLDPGRPFDRSGIATTEQRLQESTIFDQGKVTVLGNPEDEYRDVLVEVKEQNTGSISFGAGISSDAGVIGSIDLTQRNFDIADVPDSLSEFFTGKAFRGAGQFFSLNIQPGNETSLYQMVFREPYLLDSNFFLDTRLFLFQRNRDKYDEQRIGFNGGIGQRFGDVWSAQAKTRLEGIDISDVKDDASLDVLAVEGGSLLQSVGLQITRDTTDSRLFPTRGSNWVVGMDHVGPVGDYNFDRISSQFNKFWTVDEDFFGRRTVVQFNNHIGYLFQDSGPAQTSADNPDVPIFERWYAGGHRSFRGFDYRGLGPRGLVLLPVPDPPALPPDPPTRQGDDPVGGQFLFLMGLEYNYPIYQDLLRGVVFVDSGTVNSELSFDNYRVSIGAGLRIKIPFLGQAPLALDLAYPIIREEEDEVQYFSFDFALPF